MHVHDRGVVAAAESSRHLLGCQVEQGQNDAGRSCSASPVGQRLLKCRHGGAIDAPEDAGAGFRLARRATHDDARGTNLDNLQLRRANVVAIEAASRPQPPASMQAAVRNAHLEAGNSERNRSTDLRREADWKALVEWGAGDPLRVDEQRGGHGLVSRQIASSLPRR